MSLCVCGSGYSSEHCCERFLSRQQLPTTPEELMRSRFVAYTRLDLDYIAETMKPPASDEFDPVAIRSTSQQLRWTGLKVLQSSQVLTQGFVEFIASYIQNGIPGKLHEKSQFRFENGRWYYIDGELIST